MWNQRRVCSLSYIDRAHIDRAGTAISSLDYVWYKEREREGEVDRGGLVHS